MANASTYYVAAYRPCYPEKGVKSIVYTEKDFSYDALPPTLTALFRVAYVNSKKEAITVCLEKLAGKNVCVYPVIPPPNLNRVV